MNIEVKKTSGGQAEIRVEISDAEMGPFLEKAAAKASEGTKIDGFRPGKAPLDVVKGHMGEMELYQQALDFAIQATLPKAFEDHKLEVVGQPKIDVEKIAPGNPLAYKATVSLLPDLELADLDGISVKRAKLEVKDDEVAKIMGDLRRMRAKEALVDRESKEGDKVEVDFDVFRDRIPVDGGTSKKYPMVIGESQMIPGFEEQLKGMKAGEKKEFDLEFPKKYHAANLAGKKATFKVKTLAVYEHSVPEMDDEFAKGVGAASVDDLKKKITDNLMAERRAKEEERLESEIFEKIADKSNFGEIPDLLVSHEVEKMIEELRFGIDRQGLKFEDYLSNLKKTLGDLKVDFAPTAVKRVKSALVARKMAVNEKIKVRDDEVEKQIEQVLAAMAENEQADERYRSEGYKQYVRNMMANQKVTEFLKEKLVDDGDTESKE